MLQHEAFKPLQKLAVDYLGPLPASIRGKKFVAVIVDTFTRFTGAKPLSNQSSTKFAQYLTEYCRRFGLPEIMLSDNSKTFENVTVRDVMDAFHIKHQMSTPYHSRGNSVVERAIQNIQGKLSLIISNSPHDWECALPAVVLSLNTKVHKTIGHTPYEMMFGRPAPIIQRTVRSLDSPQHLHLQLVRANLSEMYSDAIANTSDAHNSSKPYFERRHRIVEYETGDKVLIKAKSRSAKLAPRYKGPFEVMSKDNDIYKLKGENNQTLTRHASAMKKFVERVLILYFAIFSCFQIGQSYMFERAAPIYWQEVPEKYVSTGTVDLVYELHLASPCPAILKFQQSQQPSNGVNQGSPPIPKQPQQLQQQQPVQQQQVQPQQVQEQQVQQQQVHNTQQQPLLPIPPQSQMMQLPVSQLQMPLLPHQLSMPMQGTNQQQVMQMMPNQIVQPPLNYPAHQQPQLPYYPQTEFYDGQSDHGTPPSEDDGEDAGDEESRKKRQVKAWTDSYPSGCDTAAQRRS